MNNVEGIIKRIFTNDKKLQLLFLTELEMSSALRRFVNLSENDAIEKAVDVMIDKTQCRLTERRCDERRIIEEIGLFVNSRRREETDTYNVERASLYLKFNE